MKKIKIIIPIMGALTTLGGIAPLLTSCNEPKPTETCVIVFNSNGGTIDGSTATKQITVNKGTKFNELLAPNVAKDNSKFIGWFDGETQYTNQVINSNVSLKAKWQDIEPTKQVSITFNPNGGVIDGSGASKIVKVNQGTKFNEILAPIATKDNNKFSGWFNGDTKYVDQTISADVVLEAHWEQIVPEIKHTVVLQCGVGSFKDTTEKSLIFKNINDKTKLNEIDNYPTLVEPTNYKLATQPWKDSKGNEIAADTSVTTDLVLTANFISTLPTLQSCTWEYLNDACVAYENSNQTVDDDAAFCAKFSVDGKPATSLTQFIGVERKVKVNGLDHRIRCIDCRHDKIADGETNAGKYTALTFEFLNLISDSSGFSLATFWNDSASGDDSNYDYTNSTIRYNLTHSGDPLSNLKYWFERGAKTYSETYSGKSVLDMILSDTGTKELNGKLKVVQKEIGTYESGWIKKTYNDILFIPTYREITTELDPDVSQKEEGSTYAYYKSHDSKENRIHKQVNETSIFTDDIRIDSQSKSYTWDAFNFAGINYDPDWRSGTSFWLSTPCILDGSNAGICNSSGGITPWPAYNNACSVAPMFCI